MLQKNKYLIFIVVILLAIAFVYFVNINKEYSANKKHSNLEQNRSTVPLENDKKLSFRDEQIKRFYSNPNDSPLLKIGDRDFRIISYGAGEGNRKEEPKSSGGIIAYQKENGEWNIFWESTEFFSESFPTIEIRDLTNDKIDEIILKVIGPTGSNLGLAVYTWQNEKFKIVTHTREVVTSIGKYVAIDLGGDIDKTKIEDIDGDNIYEIITGYEWQETPASPMENYQEIYKWDAQKQEYYLWKE